MSNDRITMVETLVERRDGVENWQLVILTIELD